MVTISRHMSEPTTENIAQFELEKARVADELKGYLAETPELRQVLQDFTASCLTLKPKDVRDYATHYFSKLQADKTTTLPPS